MGKSAFNIGQYGFFFSALAQKENRWAAAMCNLGQLTGSYLAVTSLTIFKTPTQWVLDLVEFFFNFSYFLFLISRDFEKVSFLEKSNSSSALSFCSIRFYMRLLKVFVAVLFLRYHISEWDFNLITKIYTNLSKYFLKLELNP